VSRSRKSLSLIVPVYNECGLVEKAIRECIDGLEKSFEDFELILIDDGSSDGTGDALGSFAKAEPERVILLRNNINLNVGVSVQRGMAIASKDFIVHDAIDFPLAVSDMSRLVEEMDDCDVLVIERETYASYTPWRWVTSKINRLLLRLLYGVSDIRDMNFTQFYRRQCLKRIMPLAKSPAFTTPEMIIRARRSGMRVKAVTVPYMPRTSGSGAFGRPHDILWTMYDMFRYRIRA